MNVNTIDLFCGCGGLGLGFRLAKLQTHFDIVMGADNDPAPLRVYNDNHPSDRRLPVGRLCDLTWFSHPTEFLLYYLNHFAVQKADAALTEALNSPGIDFGGFLGRIAAADTAFRNRLDVAMDSRDFAGQLAQIDSKASTTAICQAFFSAVRLTTPSRRAGIAPAGLPWMEEIAVLGPHPEGRSRPPDRALSRLIRQGLEHSWDRRLEHLRLSSQKKGRGLNATIAQRVASLVRFLEGEAGRLLRSEWLDWRTSRDSIRAQLCASQQEALRALYTEERRVRLVLGGPPCKGFSRIGRPVASSLHAQGTFSWSCDDFGDERNALFNQYVLVVSALRPDAFLFENVENFTAPLKHANNMDPPALLEEAIAHLSEERLHFTVYSGLVRAVEHAVPQSRIRYIMVGLNQASIRGAPACSPLELPQHDAPVPLEIALRGLGAAGEFVFGQPSSPDTSFLTSSYAATDPAAPASHKLFAAWIRQPGPASGTPNTTDAHIFRRLRPDDLEMLRRFAPGQRWMDYSIRDSGTLTLLRKVLHEIKQQRRLQGNNSTIRPAELDELLARCDSTLLLRLLAESFDLPLGCENHLLSNGYLEHGTGNHGDWFERLSATKPCKTIVAHIGKDTYGYFHPFLPRALTMRETARVQSFPDWFRFRRAGVVQGYAMIGNAVPPLLAVQLATRLDEMRAECYLFESSGSNPNGGRGLPTLSRRRNPYRQALLRFRGAAEGTST